MKEKTKDQIQKEIKKHLLSIAFVIIFLVIGTIYVYYPNKQDLLSSFSFLNNQSTFYIEEISSGIKLADAYPTTDDEGMQYDGYRFKIVNNENHEVKYELVFKNQVDKIKAQGAEPLASKYLRYIIKTETETTMPETMPESEVIYTAVIPAHSEKTFDFKLWLSENCDEGAMDKAYIGKMELRQLESSI